MNKAQIDKVRFYFLVKPFQFNNRSNAKEFLLKLFAKHGKKVETINYIFCDDEFLLDINRRYLNHNNYTDIITFELSEKEKPMLSDIYISTERVRENAQIFKSSFTIELHRVIFHGALHLCGFKDKSVVDAAIMKCQENVCLSQYFVSREIGFKD
jgi:rRNA maturation RNase YbeY